ncbi:MAG: ABC transporter permease [Elusimicrobiota bacterium]
MKVPLKLRLLLPGLLWLIAFYLLPMLLLGAVSLATHSKEGIVWDLTLANLLRFFEPLYLKVFLRSVLLAGIATFLCAALAFPLSWWMARLERPWRDTAVLLVLIPFWTNILVRLYAWMFILGHGGLLNTALLHLGVLDKPLQVLFTRPAVLLGLVYGQLPFMVLPLYATLEKVDPSLIDAARDLYAPPLQVFRKVLLPLSLPGLVAGSVLVFTSILCDFVTPDLLGGAKQAMIGNVIAQQYLVVRDWPFGSALSIVQMLLAGAAAFVFLRHERSEGSELRGMA